MAVRRLLMLAAIAVAAPAAAQTDAPAADAARPATTVAYKCTNADGSVIYSEQPCSQDPKKVQTIDTSSALRTGSGGYQDEIASSVADNDCREQAYKSAHAGEAQVAESNRHIADYEQRRQALQTQAAAYTTDNNATAAAPDNSQAIAEIDAAIAKEREFQHKAAANDEAAYQAALRRCDEQLRQSAPKPAPAQPAPASDQNGGG